MSPSRRWPLVVATMIRPMRKQKQMSSKPTNQRKALGPNDASWPVSFLMTRKPSRRLADTRAGGALQNSTVEEPGQEHHRRKFGARFATLGVVQLVAGFETEVGATGLANVTARQAEEVVAFDRVVIDDEHDATPIATKMTTSMIAAPMRLPTTAVGSPAGTAGIEGMAGVG